MRFDNFLLIAKKKKRKENVTKGLDCEIRN